MKRNNRDRVHNFSALLKMEVEPIKSHRSRLARTIAKVLHIRALTGIVPDDGIRRIKSGDNKNKVKNASITAHQSQSQSLVNDDEDEKLRNRATMEAFLAKLFASISSVKAAYAELQNSQSPYNADGIQSADQTVVKELKNLSELKQCWLKKQLDSSPQVTLLLAELQEQQSLLKTYEIMRRKMESQLELKNSEVTSLREKFEESENHNKSLEKRLNPTGSSSLLDNLYLSGLNPNHFVSALRQTVKSIRSFVKSMINEMGSAGWDLDLAASSIEPGVVYAMPSHKCFTFESFVCREMFDGFHYPNFSLPNESLPERKQRRKYFFDRFTELKSVNPKEYLDQKPRSTFGKFCRVKYIRLVHPKMESSFFGDLNQRSLVNSGGFPETAFFDIFAEMAKRVWLLHCLAFSFEPEASIFLVKKKCRFSEVYMESVTEEVASVPDGEPQVGFGVVPGFKIGKTVIQCEVYLSPA